MLFYWTIAVLNVRGCLLIFTREWMHWGDEIAYPLAQFTWTNVLSQWKNVFESIFKMFLLSSVTCDVKHWTCYCCFQLVRPGCGWGVLSSSFMLLYVTELIKHFIFLFMSDTFSSGSTWLVSLFYSFFCYLIHNITIWVEGHNFFLFWKLEEHWRQTGGFLRGSDSGTLER